MHLLYAIAAILSCAGTAFAEQGESSWIQDRLAGLDGLLGTTVDFLATILLFDFGTGVPLIVAILLLGGIYYSFYLGWFSVRAFAHAIAVLRASTTTPPTPVKYRTSRP